jgi:hypothetical protein
MRRCRGCDRELPDHEFHIGSSRCRECKNRQWRERYAVQSAEWKARRRAREAQWRAASPHRYLLARARTSARLRGLEFDLGPADLPDPLPTVCPVLGCMLRYDFTERPGSRRQAHPCAASLDRLDSRRGYVRGNVAVISWRANVLKQDATLEELELLIRWMRQLGVESEDGTRTPAAVDV